MNGWKLNLALAVLLLLLGAIVFGVFDSKRDEQKQPALIADYKASAVTHIELRQAQFHCELAREPQSSNWRVIAPFNAAASTLAVQKLLQLPARHDYQIVAANSDELQQFDLATPPLNILINNWSIAWGGLNSLDQRRYLKIGEKVLLVSEDIDPFLQDCPKNLLSKALLEPGQTLTGLQLPALSVKQENGVWKIEPQPPSAWTQDDVNRYLDDWRSAQALMVEALDKRVLQQAPEYRVQLQLNSGEVNFLAYRLKGQIWWACPERELQYYFFDNSVQKLLQPFPHSP